MATLAEGFAHSRDYGLTLWEVAILRDSARIEAGHGDAVRVLGLYAAAIATFELSGNVTELAVTLGSLATFLGRSGRAEVAATLCGAATRFAPVTPSVSARGLDRLRAALGSARFEHLATVGAAMEPARAVGYARDQIRLARDELAISAGAERR